jgi:hypothetical protein|tara:strand:- start:180 stop:848 length:669 start_codon:yes stop_codon:yes gene_type:complete
MTDTEQPRYYPFGVTFEDNLKLKRLPIPKEIEGRDHEWDELNLIAHDLHPEFQCEDGEWVELLIAPHGVIYKQVETQQLVKSNEEGSFSGVKPESTSSRLELVEDFTGVINCSFYSVAKEEAGGGEDYHVIWKAVFVHGVLDTLVVSEVKKQNARARAESLEKLQEAVSGLVKDTKRQNSKVFHYAYRPWRFVLQGAFLITAFIWQIPLVALKWVVKKLTPY